jgi:hypothetical protein
MTGKLKVVRTIKAGHADIKNICEKEVFAGEVLRVRYYMNKETKETFKTVEIVLKNKS